jgi:WD40 repeat protein/serine/threonine protein kinase
MSPSDPPRDLTPEQPSAGPTVAYQPPAAPLAAPRVERLGEYRILRELGRGGMGVVYEAVQESLGRHVALKVLPAAALLSPMYLERFQREAKAAARLHHTNIVPVFGVGEVGGVHFYAMQFIRGEGLDKVLADVRKLRQQPSVTPPATVASREGLAPSLLTGRFSVSAPDAPTDPSGRAKAPRSGDSTGGPEAAYYRGVARLGVQVAEALAYAHRQGVLHRDVKPSNLLLDAQGTVWVTDFGLAKAEGAEELTQTGDILGTIRFMAPERFEGKSLPESDVYALGATLYELLTLRPAFADTSRPRLIERVLREPPVAPRKIDPHIPRDLETVVLKCLAKRPEERYRGAEALAEELRRFLADRPILARRATAPERAWRWCRRNPVVASLMALVALTLVAGATVSLLFAVEAMRQRDDATEQSQRANDEAARANREADAAWASQYAAHMALMASDSDIANIDRIRPTLEIYLQPPPGRKDLRGWEWYYQERFLHQETRSVLAHDALIYDLAFSPDGTRLATASGDTTAVLWDAATCHQVAFLPHPDKVTGVAFSPDGKLLASGCIDRTVRLWEVTTRRVVRTLQGHTDIIDRLAFSPDGKRLASAGHDKTIRLWDVATGREAIPPLTGHASHVKGVAFSPDGKHLASGGNDKALKIWEVATGRLVRSLEQKEGVTHQVWRLAFSPDGTRLAWVGQDWVVKVWELDTGWVRHLNGHTDGGNALAFSPDGARLATGGNDLSVRLWDLATYQEVQGFTGHTDWIMAVAFSPDGTRLLSVGHDGTIRTWDPVPAGPFRSRAGHSEPVTGVACSPDGTRLATASNDKTLKLWDVATGQEIRTFKGHTDRVMGVAFGPDGKRLASAGQDKTVRVWEADTGRELLSLTGHADAVRAVSFSADGARLVSAGRDNTVKTWDAATGELVRSFDWQPAANPKFVAFSPDGARMAWGERDKMKLWDVATGREVLGCVFERNLASSVAYTADGARMAAADNMGNIKLFDLESAREPRAVKGTTKELRSMAFSPDGTRLAAACVDGTVQLWDAVSGQQLYTLKGRVGILNGLVFTPDGARLAGASSDKDLKLWDAREWRPQIETEAEAMGLLQALFAKPLPASEVRAAVEKQPILSDDARRLALRLIDRFTEETDPKKYHDGAWPILRHPYANQVQCRFALAQTEAASRLAPDHANGRILLAIARYRLGRFDKEEYSRALEALGRCDADHPWTLAFLAMTQQQLGRRDEARTSLARLREVKKDPKWAKNAPAEAFLREATALVEAKP